jgi:hypothetical protein
LTISRGDALFFGLERDVILNLHPLSTDTTIGVAIAHGVIIKMGMLANLPTVGTREGAAIIVEPDGLRLAITHDEELPADEARLSEDDDRRRFCYLCGRFRN